MGIHMFPMSINIKWWQADSAWIQTCFDYSTPIILALIWLVKLSNILNIIVEWVTGTEVKVDNNFFVVEVERIRVMLSMSQLW